MLLHELDTSHLDRHSRRASVKDPRPSDERCLRVPTWSGASRVDRPAPILSKRFRPCQKGFFSAIRPSVFLPLDSSEPLFQGPCTSIVCRSRRCDCRFPLAEISLFCTILVQSKSFRCNTSEPPPMCCKQRTCAIPKSRRCNTYKKHGGGAHPSFLTCLPPCLHSSSPRRRPFRRKLEHALS